MEIDIRNKTIELIDNLKSITNRFGIRNDGSEYKIIVQTFLYKFLNDKFTYEVKKISNKLKNSLNWEKDYEEMSEEEKEEILYSLNPETPKLNPEHLISNLWSKQNEPDFDKTLDRTLEEIAIKNDGIFSTKTAQNTKVLIFEKMTDLIEDEKDRILFARSLIDKLINFSFEESFDKGYDFFAFIFEYLIKDYNINGGGDYAEYYTPQAIAVIMAELLVGDQKDLKDINIYDPSAGTGTLLMALLHKIGQEKCQVFAQDMSQRSNRMLKLNLILNGSVVSLDNVIRGDTLVYPYHTNDDGSLKEFDFVVSNPPFKVDFSETREQIVNWGNSRFWAGVPNIPQKDKKKMPIYVLFLQHVINSLSKNGKGAIVVPTGFITSKTGIEAKVLQRIIDNKIVYACISMPSNVFANTGTNVSVLFFDKNNKDDKVILIDASKMGEDYQEDGIKKKRLTKEDIEKITKTFKNKEVVDDFSVVVNYEEIIDKKYSLSPGQYFDIKIEYSDMSEEEFELKMDEYKKQLEDYFSESDKLQKEILEQLGKLKYE